MPKCASGERGMTTSTDVVRSPSPTINRVHASGTPFTDRSGDRLREWMGVSPQEFYNEAWLAIIPMGFCFPGQNASGADLPPRPECATLWHRKLFAVLPQLELVLAVGAYAQDWHLGERAGATLQDTILSWRQHLESTGRPRVLPLPHPRQPGSRWTCKAQPGSKHRASDRR